MGNQINNEWCIIMICGILCTKAFFLFHFWDMLPRFLNKTKNGKTKNLIIYSFKGHILSLTLLETLQCSRPKSYAHHTSITSPLSKSGLEECIISLQLWFACSEPKIPTQVEKGHNGGKKIKRDYRHITSGIN